MRVLFVNAVLGGDYSALDIAITQLATFINRRTGHVAGITDLVFHRKEWKKYLDTEIKIFGPDVIAFSCNTMYLQYVRLIVGYINEKYSFKIICGGYHASLKPEETLSIEGVDAVFIGDGEYPLKEYLDSLQGRKIPIIPGVWVKEKGKIIRNDGGKFIDDIDSLPFPDWSLWKDLNKYFYYLGMLYMIGTRGCVYRCSYCDAHEISDKVEGKYYRIINPEIYARHISMEWKRYKGRGMRLAQLFDQIPTLDINWLSRFCASYRKYTDAGSNKFSMFSRVDHLNEDKIRLLSGSGCGILRLGVESGNDFIRNDVYAKKISLENIRNVFRLCKEYGIVITSYYLIGGPGESRKTMNDTIRLAQELDASRSAFFVFKPFTRESINLIEKYGGRIRQERWNNADNITYGAVVDLKGIKAEQVENLQKKAYFLTMLRRLFRMIRKEPLGYFLGLSIYLFKAFKDDLDFKYAIPYYHIYGYDYVRF